MSFEAIEAGGVSEFLERIRAELILGEYVPLPNRRKEIPKDGGRKVRVLGIPSIRDLVVHGCARPCRGAEPRLWVRSGSYGYRPGRTTHEAVERVARAIRQGKTRVIDLDVDSPLLGIACA